MCTSHTGNIANKASWRIYENVHIHALARLLMRHFGIIWLQLHVVVILILDTNPMLHVSLWSYQNQCLNESKHQGWGFADLGVQRVRDLFSVCTLIVPTQKPNPESNYWFGSLWLDWVWAQKCRFAQFFSGGCGEGHAPDPQVGRAFMTWLVIQFPSWLAWANSHPWNMMWYKNYMHVNLTLKLI